jgi:hypothetical protein
LDMDKSNDEEIYEQSRLSLAHVVGEGFEA